jgi:hypothetical protein
MLRIQVDSEPLWTRLDRAPLAVRMALEEIGGQTAGQDLVAKWVCERLRVTVDLRCLGIDAEEAMAGVVEVPLSDVSLPGSYSGRDATFAGVAKRPLHITAGLADGAMKCDSPAGAVSLTWVSAAHDAPGAWPAARALVSLDRAPEHDTRDEASELSPIEWFEGEDPRLAGRRSGRKLRFGIQVSEASLKRALSRHSIPMDLRAGCPWAEAASRQVSVGDARRWLSKHLCFEVQSSGGDLLLGRLESQLEQLRGARIIEVTKVQLVDGWPVVDVETKVTVESDGEPDADQLASMSRALRLAWRDGVGTVGEQERYELDGSRIPVSITCVGRRPSGSGRRAGRRSTSED